MKIKIALTLIISCCFAQVAQASNSDSAVVTDLIVVNGKVFFNQSSNRTTRPSCATIGNRWVFDGSTAQGQAMLSILLTLKAQGRPMRVMGTGTCPDWPDTETVQYLLEG